MAPWLGVPYSSYWRVDALERAALDSLTLAKTQVLIVEEVQQMLAGSAREQRLAFNLIKSMANDLRISIVAVGTGEARHAIEADPQIRRRFTPLILKRYGWREDMNDVAENASPPLTGLEVAIASQVREFEEDIAGALRGRAPVSAAGTLTASSFLIVAQELLSFAVEIWQTERKRSVRTIQQQANEMNFHAATLFRHDTAHGRTVRRPDDPPIQLRHLADPAARRAALWLVLQVIWYIPSGERLALRLGDTPQDSFFGTQRHTGWAWLTERAHAWPIRYRRRHWHGFVEDADNLKVQVTPLKG